MQLNQVRANRWTSKIKIKRHSKLKTQSYISLKENNRKKTVFVVTKQTML